MNIAYSFAYGAPVSFSDERNVAAVCAQIGRVYSPRRLQPQFTPHELRCMHASTRTLRKAEALERALVSVQLRRMREAGEAFAAAVRNGARMRPEWFE